MVCTRDLIRYIRITFEYENTKVNSTNIFWEGVGGVKRTGGFQFFGEVSTLLHAMQHLSDYHVFSRNGR